MAQLRRNHQLNSMVEAHLDGIQQRLDSGELVDVARVGITRARDLVEVVRGAKDSEGGIEASLRDLIRRKQEAGTEDEWGKKV